MKPKQSKPKAAPQPADQKVPCFLRLPPALHSWLAEEVATGRYGNVQDKIVEVLREAHEAKQEQVA